MRVASALARRWSRQRWVALTLLVAVFGIGLAIGLVALETAQRSDRAYPSYLRSASVGQLVVNPSFASAQEEQILASTPGVASYTRDGFYSATADAGAPRTLADVDTTTVVLRSSDDGRYVTSDRPVVRAGRMVSGPGEAFVSPALADRLHLRVGDETPLSFWASSVTGQGAGPLDIVHALGTATVRVVGIGVFADEVFPDQLYSHELMVVSHSVVAPYDCNLGTGSADDHRTIDQLFPELVPQDCALQYRYYSVHVAGGAAAAPAVSHAISDHFDAANGTFAPALRDAHVGYAPITTVTEDEKRRVQQSIGPAVTALRVFGVVALAASVVALLLGALRTVRVASRDVRTWSELGATSKERRLALALPLVGVLVAAAPLGVLLAWFASPVGPVGSVRVLVPHRTRGLSPGITAVAVAGALVLGVIGVALIARAGARLRPAPSVRPLSALARRVGTRRSPAAGLGVQAAVTGGAGRVLLAGSVVTLTAVLATCAFSTSLGGLVDRPQQYGWPYDVGVMVGYGYGGVETDVVKQALNRPEVKRYAAAAPLGTLSVAGQAVPTVAARDGFTSFPLPVLSGQLPTGPDEIALGSRTAHDLRLHVGDHPTLTGDYGTATAHVVGIIVLPPIGPYQSGRAALGTGVLLSSAFYDALATDVAAAQGTTAAELDDARASFIAIDLRDGVDPAAFVASLGPDLSAWSADRYVPLVFTRPVRPAQISDVASMRRVPVLLGIVLGGALLAAVAGGLAASTRRRRPDLALLRALGCTRRQIRATVRAHALTTVGIGLVIGAPLGIAVGRITYRAFASSIGAGDRTFVSIGWTAAVIAATVVSAFLVAEVTGRLGTRRPAATDLRQG